MQLQLGASLNQSLACIVAGVFSKVLNESAPTKEVLTIKSLDAFAAAADGKATKIIIPSELQGLASLATTASELFDKKD